MAEDQVESATEEAAEEKPSAETLSKLTDQELMDLLGLSRTLDKAKQSIQEVLKLSGEARKIADERIEKMLTPNIYPYDFEHLAQDAKREAARKTNSGKAAMLDDSPASIDF